ncbi:MAG: anti-sigma factor family protein, partial [Gemmataceae bacterium]
MSDHAWILENLAAYLTGGLESAERERLETHTVECASCAAVLANTRAMDATLTGLFVEARPSATLEDRVIQTLRKRPTDTWRLPMPAWLALAAAALVLIGFTGAVASQILVQGKFPSTDLSELPDAVPRFMGVFDGSKRAEAGQDVEQLALASRQGMMSELERPRGLNQENNQLGFYPPAQHLSVKSASTIHTRSSGLTDPEKNSPRRPTSPPIFPPGYSSHSGMMGMAGGMGMMGVQPNVPPPPASPYLNTLPG